MTKQDLYDYRKLGLEICTLEESRVKLRRQIAEFQASKYKPIAKDERKTLTDALIRMEKLDKVYGKRIGEIMRRRLHVETFVAGLDDSEERNVIHLRYIEGCGWEEVCVKAHCGWDKVHRINKRVLAQIT